MTWISDAQHLIKAGHSNTRFTKGARGPQNVTADIDKRFRYGIAQVMLSVLNIFPERSYMIE
jgi:hypothetical protein